VVVDTRIVEVEEAEDMQVVTLAEDTEHRNASYFDTISKSSKFVHVHDNS